MARMIAAHTTHGGSTAAKRAMQRYVSTLAARMRLFGAALRLRAHLPAEMAARLALGPAELKAPPRPIQGAFAANESPTTSNVRNGAATVRGGRDSGNAGGATRLVLGPAELKAPECPIQGAFAANEPSTTSNVRNGRRAARRWRRFSRAGGAAGLVPPGRAAERLAALAEAERQAPWRRAIGFARAANRAARGARVAQRAASVRATGGKARIARPNDMQRENAAEAPGLCDGGGGPVSEATAQRRSGPGSALNGATALQCELALWAAGLRARTCGQDPGDVALKPGPDSKIPEPNAIERENAAQAPCGSGGGSVSGVMAERRSGLESALNGATALQRELALRAAGLRARNCGQDPGDAALKPGPGSKIPEPNPMNREPAAARRLTRLTPTKAAALCSTPLAGTWQPSLRSVLTLLFARGVPSGWFVPQASRLMAGAGAAWNRGCCETPKRAYET
jgi:hypothetical protein